MILLADENLHAQVVQRLRRDGHKVLAIAEIDPGINDDQVLAMANQNNALLITEDKVFGEMIFRRKLVHA